MRVLILFLFVFLSACANIKYSDKDGMEIFTQTSNIAESPRLFGIMIETQEVNINECMLTNDFDPQKAHISMNSYPEIEEKQYDRLFKRIGKYDFYIHPIICDNKVIDVKKNGEIVMYKLIDNKVKKEWSIDTLKFKERRNILVSFARLYNDTLYIATNNGFVIAFDINKKEIIWKKQFKSSFMSSPNIGDNKIFLVSTSDELYAINIENGELEWSIQEEQKITKSLQTASVLIYKDRLIAGFSNGNILMVKQSNGNILWKANVYSNSSNMSELTDIDFPPVIFFDKVVVAGGIGTSVMGFDISSGRPLWLIETPLNSFILQNNQGFGFFVDRDNNNVCFNGMTGEIKSIKNDGPNIGTKEMPGYFNEGNNTYTWRINRYYDAYFDE